MKIEMHSYYDHFPNHKHDIPFEPYIDMYNDEFVWQSTRDSCVLLIEPRSIIPTVYAYVQENWRKFKYVFTHDSQIKNR